MEAVGQVAYRPPPDHQHHVGGGLAKRAQRTLRCVEALVVRHREPDRNEISGGERSMHERHVGHVGTEIRHLPAVLAHEVGQHRYRQGVALTGRSPEDDGTPGAATTHEPRTEPADQPHGDPRRSVLQRHVEIAALPPVADGGHRRSDHLSVHLVEPRPCSKRCLDHTPGTSRITRQQPRFEPLGPRRPPPAPAEGLRSHRPAGAELDQIGVGHVPGAGLLGGGQQAQPHVAVHGHVVHVERICCLVERQIRFGHHATLGTASCGCVTMRQDWKTSALPTPRRFTTT